MKQIPFVYSEYGGSDEYTKYLEQIAKDGVCPFCKKHLSKYHKEPIIEEFENWLLTTNQHRGKRFLVILKEHKTSIEDLPIDVFVELQEIFKFVVNKNSLRGATLLVRSGHPKNTGGTVGHLHAQIISGNPDNPNYEPIITRVG